MRIYNSYDAGHNNLPSFSALIIKKEKKWPKSELKIMIENKKLQELVKKCDKVGVDVIAESMPPIKKYGSILILLKDSYGNILSCANSDTFKYDLFDSNFCFDNYKYICKKEKSNISKKIKNFLTKPFRKN